MMLDWNTNLLNDISLPSTLKFHELLGFVRILREAPKLFFRNGKLMSAITILMILFSCIFLVMNIYSIKPLVTDFIFKATFLTLTSPQSPEFFDLMTSLNNDFQLLVRLEGTFILAFSFISLCFAISSILASGVTYCGQNLSVKELLSRVVKLFKRPFATWFYLLLLHLGYCGFLIAFVGPLVVLFSFDFKVPGFSLIVLIVAIIFQAYLAVDWNLALIVTVLEGEWGIEALAKAGQLIKGSKLRGFFLNILFRAFSVAVVYSFRKIAKTAFTRSQIVITLLLLSSISFIWMFSLIAYTVLYYECKETHGEELEMQGGFEYTKVTAVTPLISSDETC